MFVIIKKFSPHAFSYGVSILDADCRELSPSDPELSFLPGVRNYIAPVQSWTVFVLGFSRSGEIFKSGEILWK